MKPLLVNGYHPKYMWRRAFQDRENVDIKVLKNVDSELKTITFLVKLISGLQRQSLAGWTSLATMNKQLSERVPHLVTTKKRPSWKPRRFVGKTETMILSTQKVADLLKLIHKQLTKRRITI